MILRAQPCAPRPVLTISAVPVMASSGIEYIWCLVFTLHCPASPSPTFTSITLKLVPPRSSDRKSPTSAATGRSGSVRGIPAPKVGKVQGGVMREGYRGTKEQGNPWASGAITGLVSSSRESPWLGTTLLVLCLVCGHKKRVAMGPGR